MWQVVRGGVLMQGFWVLTLATNAEATLLEDYTLDEMSRYGTVVLKNGLCLPISPVPRFCHSLCT